MALVDTILNQINLSLESNLDWLTTAYGKVSPRVRVENNKEYRFPAIYSGDAQDNYISMLPNTSLGNFSYWETEDPLDYQNINRNFRVSFRFKLVVWFYWPDVYPSDWQDRSLQEVIEQVLQVLAYTQYTNMVTVFETSEKADHIYNGGTLVSSRYSHDEIERQFLMRPYGGFSIEGEVLGTTACNLELQTPVIPPAIQRLLPFNYTTTKQTYPLEKWKGDWFVVQLFEMSNGNEGVNDGYQTINLDPNTVGEIIVEKCGVRSINSVDGSVQSVPFLLVPDGSTYKMFFPDYTTSNQVLIAWVEA